MMRVLAHCFLRLQIVHVFQNRKKEEMLVLVNNKTRFIVIVYQFKRSNFNNVKSIMNPLLGIRSLQ